MKNDNLIIGLALIVGAWLYSKRTTRNPATVARAQGAGSMPGSAGSGAAQVAGGFIGSLLAKMSGGGTSTGAPVASNTPPYVADNVLNNSISAADPLATFNPDIAPPDLSANDLASLTGYGI